MDEPIADLKEENYKNVCRLCLQEDEDFTINIFDRIDPNPRKRPLSLRIFELYQIRVRFFFVVDVIIEYFIEINPIVCVCSCVHSSACVCVGAHL